MQPMQTELTINDRIRKMHIDELYCDLKILVHVRENQNTKDVSLLAHKAILALGSPVLAKKIDECEKGSYSDVLTIDDDCTAFRNLLWFLYTDEVKLNNTTETLNTYLVAKKYKVEQLKKKCAKLLTSEEISLETVCQVLHVTILENSHVLKNKCLLFVAENTAEIFRCEAFLKLTPAAVRLILKKPRLSLSSETEVFRALMKWMKNHYCDTEANNSWEAARRDAESYLNKIRFLTMTEKEFLECSRMCNGLISKDDGWAILMAISSPKNSLDLPQWVHKDRSVRCDPIKSESCNFQEPKINQQKPKIYQQEPKINQQERKINQQESKINQQESKKNKESTAALVNFNLTDTVLNAETNKNSFLFWVEMKFPRGRRGRYHLKGTKLKWKIDPCNKSLICGLTYIITVSIFPSNYTFKEKARRVEQIEEEDFEFSKVAYLGPADSIAVLEVKVIDVTGCRFLAADPAATRNSGDVPLDIEISNRQNDESFIISEIYFEYNEERKHKFRSQNFSKKTFV